MIQHTVTVYMYCMNLFCACIEAPVHDYVLFPMSTMSCFCSSVNESLAAEERRLMNKVFGKRNCSVGVSTD